MQTLRVSWWNCVPLSHLGRTLSRFPTAEGICYVRCHMPAGLMSTLSLLLTHEKWCAGQNLLSMWTSRIKSQHNKRHMEFAGRAENPDSLKAELYIHLQEEDM